MYLRENTGTTLGDLYERVNESTESTQVSPGEVEVDLTSDDPHIKIGGVTLPVTSRGQDVLSALVKVPSAFYTRLLPDEREFVLRRTIARHGGAIGFRYDQEGLVGAHKPGVIPLNPGRLVTAVSKVLGEDAQVVAYNNDVDEFSFDVVTSRDEGLGVGGDRSVTLEQDLAPGSDEPKVRRMVGDITKGGVALLYSRGRQNLAPQIQPFAYRLWCTNGCDFRDPGLTIDMRHMNTVDEVLAEVERAAQIAMGRIEADISAMYDLRSRRVDNPERALRAMATEHRLSDRMTMRLIDRIPAEFQDDDAEITEFDLVNLITNEANSPALRTTRGASRQLRAVGGAITTAHAARCSHCNHKLRA